MSKMSNLHAELSEQACELGFESLEQAEQAGYGIDYENARLVEPETQAHKAWLEEKQHALGVVDVVKDVLNDINKGLVESGDAEMVEAWSLVELTRELDGVMKFIKEAHD